MTSEAIAVVCASRLVPFRTMPFPIDVSHPFRYPSELRRLVEAVRRAGGYDETRWIEWKRTLDLTATASIRHIAKQILGFANRDPQVAAAWTGGYAYLVIGASPEALGGVTQIDPEQLVSKVRPYVGSAVTWTPEYIEVDGTAVLVIIVEPPRPGDEIHVLRKALEPYRPGTVFIRRHGQADQADADELGMLQRRLLAGTTHIQLSVEPVVPQIEEHPDLRGRIHTWIDQVRACGPDQDEDWEERPGKLSSLFRRKPADYRTPTRYDGQITNYFFEAQTALLKRIVWDLARHDPAKLALRVVNRGDQNYTEVVVTLRIETGAVKGYDEERLELFGKDQPPPLPKRPPPWGTQTAPQSARYAHFVEMNEPTHLDEPEQEGGPIWSRGWQATNVADEVYIEFDPCNLRPHETAQLPAVPLMVRLTAGETLSVGWAATATNANGRITGTCAISVVESTLGLWWLNSYLRSEE
jgi:hypothetical protein